MSESFDMSAYMDVFMTEAEDQLALLEEDLVKLEKESSPEILQELFRAAHTLKRASASMGFKRLANLTHAMENVLDALRHEELAVSSEIVDILLASLDALQALKATLETGAEGDIPVDPLLERLRGVTQSGRGGETTAKGGAAASLDVKLDEHEQAAVDLARMRSMKVLIVTVTLRSGCPMKGIRAALVVNAAERLGDVIKCVPDAEALEDEKFDDSFRFVVITSEDPEKIKSDVGSLSEIRGVTFDSLGEAQEAHPPAQPAAETRDDDDGDETESSADDQPSTAIATPSAATPAADAGQHVKRTTNVRVNVEQLDNLMNLVAELVVDRTVLEQVRVDLADRLGRQSDIAADLEEAVTRISRRTADLQDEIMKARMQPVDTVFSRFPRMLRDLAQKAKKKIDFQIFGGETELDRSVIEVISDPLIHTLRNAVDHGIESPEDRLAAGKEEVGSVVLSARHEESYIVIEVQDDGKGINPEKIKKLAVERGVLSQEAADRMSEREAIELVFAPGFSTAEKITDVSGRGVGMDIVRTNIERINGRVEVHSVVGEGTVTAIRLPLTLAIIQSLLVRANDRTYALPLASVRETERRPVSEIQTIQGGETVVCRNRVLPLVRINRALNFRRVAVDDPADRLFIVVVSVGDREAGIVVDRLIGEQEIVIKPLGKFLGDVRGISGATILGDGTIALICDVGALLDKVADEVRDGSDLVLA